MERQAVMSRPDQNATLLALYGPGVPDRNGTVALPGAAEWEGEHAAYITRAAKRQYDADQVSVIEEDQVIVRAPTGLPTGDIRSGMGKVGWWLLVRDERHTSTVEVTARIIAVDYRAIGSEVDSLRLTIDADGVDV